MCSELDYLLWLLCMLLLLDCLRFHFSSWNRCSFLLFFCDLQGLVQGHNICDSVILGFGCWDCHLRCLIFWWGVFLHAISFLVFFGLYLLSCSNNCWVLWLLSFLRKMLAEDSNSCIATILHLVWAEIMYIGLVNLRENSLRVLRLNESVGLSLEIRSQVIVRVV